MARDHNAGDKELEASVKADETARSAAVDAAFRKRNAGVPPERRIEFRVGIHLGDVVEEADGDLMGDGVRSWLRTWSATAGSPARTRTAPCRGSGGCEAI